MLDKSIQNWHHFPGGIMARTARDADYIYQYLTLVRYSRSYLKSMEIHDFQRYKVVRKAGKVFAALQLTADEREFIFPFHLN